METLVQTLDSFTQTNKAYQLAAVSREPEHLRHAIHAGLPLLIDLGQGQVCLVVGYDQDPTPAWHVVNLSDLSTVSLDSLDQFIPFILFDSIKESLSFTGDVNPRRSLEIYPSERNPAEYP
jgi:hypothetical protein